MRDIFIEKKFEKSDIPDLFKGHLSNLCPVHFIRLFTTGAIVLIGSSKDIYTIRSWRKYLSRLFVTWSKCQNRDFSYPDSILVEIRDFQAKSGWLDSLDFTRQGETSRNGNGYSCFDYKIVYVTASTVWYNLKCDDRSYWNPNITDSMPHTRPLKLNLCKYIPCTSSSFTLYVL